MIGYLVTGSLHLVGYFVPMLNGYKLICPGTFYCDHSIISTLSVLTGCIEINGYIKQLAGARSCTHSAGAK